MGYLQSTTAHVIRSAVARGAAVSHTHPHSLRLISVPRRRARASKELRARRIAARKGCSQHPTKTMSYLQPVTNARRAPSRIQIAQNEERARTRPARRHPFGQVENTK